MTRIIFCLIIFCSSIRCLGQYDGSQPDMSPVTPNEAALLKPLAQPVGNFTGTVPTSIALFTAGKGNLQMPISLSNSGMALKVQERASSVGLGWSLHAGGSVTRVLRGIPDDYPNGYLSASYKPSNFSKVIGLDTSVQVFQSVINNHLDLQPDQFYFSCDGLSGRFWFDESGNVRIEDQSGATVVPVFQNVLGWNYIMGWILTDTKGNKYYFGLNKAQNVQMVDPANITFSSQNGYTNLPPNVAYNATWYLVEIDDMSQENVVRFDYQSAGTDFETITGGYMALQRGNVINCNASDMYGDQIFGTTVAQEKYLKTIVTPKDSIAISNSTRTDYDGSLEVDSIRQYDQSGIMQKMVHFHYGYFNNGSGTGSSRLRLLNISQWGNTRTDSLTYSFDYFTDYNLPNYLSAGQDYWGYYNGKDYNTSLLPNGTYNFYGFSMTEYAFGDRRAYFPACRANMLSTIHYPTGGYRQFTYEANMALFEGTSEVVPDGSYSQNFSLHATTWVPYPGSPQYQAYFDINSFSGSAAWNFNLSGCCFSGTYTVKILDSVSHTVLYTFTNTLNQSVSLTNGHYQVQFIFNTTQNTFTAFDATWSQTVINAGGITLYGKGFYRANMTVGGVRVQQVSDFDPISGGSVTTKFKYLLYSQDSTLTSGLLISTPLVASQATCAERAGCQLIRLSSYSAYPLATSGGSYVVYPEVRIYQDGNGYTSQVYSFQFDDVGMNNEPNIFPFLPPDLGWVRGKLISQKVVDNAGNLLKSVMNYYPGINDTSWTMLSDSILGYKMIGYKNSSGMVTDGCFTPYYYTRQFIAPSRSYEYNYSPSGTQTIATYYSYYNSVGRPFIKQEKHDLNNGLLRLINYYYSFNNLADFNIGLTTAESGMLSPLLTANYLLPLELTTQSSRWGTTSFVNGTKNGFGYFNAAKIHPLTTKSFTTLNDSTVMNFSRYDLNGNLVEQYKSNDIKTAWIWDYNGTLPIAKVVNADSSVIAFTGFEADGSGNWSIGSTLRNTYGITGNKSYSLGNGACTKTGLTTSSVYILSYWTKTGSAYTVTGSTGVVQGKTITINGLSWTYFEHTVTGVSTVTVSGTGDIDELRLYPKNGQMTTYAYSPLLGVTSICDIDNRVTYYEYDGLGRLKDVKDQDGNVIKTYQYHYFGH